MPLITADPGAQLRCEKHTNLVRELRPELAVRDELEQAPVRIAEVHVPATAARARLALQRPRHDCDSVVTQMDNCILDGAGPDEAEIAVSRFDRPVRVQ